MQEPILSFEDNSGKFDKSAFCNFAKVSKFKNTLFPYTSSSDLTLFPYTTLFRDRKSVV